MYLRKIGCSMQHKLINIFLVAFMLFGLGQELLGQVQWGKESLTRGKVWVTIANSYRLGEVDLPWPFYALDYPGHSSGSDLSDKPTYIDAGGYAIYGERGGVAAAHTINGRFYAAAQYMTATANATLIQNFNMEDPALLAEEIVTGGLHVIDLDVDIDHKSMVWSYPKYDDFVIHEFTITNTGATALDNVHFGTRLAIWASMRGDWLGPGDDYDDKYGWSDEHDIFYFYDDRSFIWEDETPVTFLFGPGPTTGDIGDPADITESGARDHELLSPAYITSIVLDSAGANVNMNILEYLGQGTSSEGPPEDLMARLGTDAPAYFKTVMTHQQPRMSWDAAKAGLPAGEGGNKYERSPEMLVSVGPLSIAAGASETVVFAEVLGEMDRAKIIEGGDANVALMATASRDSLFANVAAARELYAAGYDVADPPPTPTDGEGSLILTPIDFGVEVAWPPVPSTYTDPDLGTNDLAGYRVYRSTEFVTGPWELVDDLTLAEVTTEGDYIVYESTDLYLGVGYYYAVSSYDADGNESGLVNANRFPVYPLRAANEDFPSERVHVVPNPFRQHSGLLGSGEELRMEFIGLPSACTIRIYTLAGDLVREIDHDDGSGAESWGSILTLDYQTNKWLLYVVPGFYVYHVESHATGTDGKSFVGKFAIIR